MSITNVAVDALSRIPNGQELCSASAPLRDYSGLHSKLCSSYSLDTRRAAGAADDG